MVGLAKNWPFPLPTPPSLPSFSWSYEAVAAIAQILWPSSFWWYFLGHHKFLESFYFQLKVFPKYANAEKAWTNKEPSNNLARTCKEHQGHKPSDFLWFFNSHSRFFESFSFPLKFFFSKYAYDQKPWTNKVTSKNLQRTSWPQNFNQWRANAAAGNGKIGKFPLPSCRDIFWANKNKLQPNSGCSAFLRSFLQEGFISC